MEEYYYYLDADQQQKGPISPSDFIRLGINQNTLLWKEGMADWQKAGAIPELSAYFQSTPPPPPVSHAGPSLQKPVQPIVPPASPVTQKPDSYLIWSILTTVLCCLPLGIVAIIYSTKVDPLWDKGQYDEAMSAAKNAKTFCILSVVLGLIGCIFAFIGGIMGALSEL